MTDTAHDWPFDKQALRDFAEEMRQAMRTRRHQHRHGGPFGGGGPWMHGGRGFPFAGPPFGGRRASRGDIRAAILALLNEQPMHGYQIIQELERRTEGAWRASPGSVYPTLQQLQDEGLVSASEEEGGRRVFSLTGTGRAEAQQHVQTPPWQDVAGNVDDTTHSIKGLLMQVAAATWQVAAHGTAAQQTQAHDVLRDARRRLYQILAEDAPKDV